MTIVQGEVAATNIEATNDRVIRINLKKVNWVLGALIIVGFIYYLTSANSLSIKSFALRDLKYQSNQLADANTALQVRLADLGSYTSISQRLKKLNLVAVGNVKFINQETLAVAKK